MKFRNIFSHQGKLNNMRFPQGPKNTNPIRELYTSDMEALAKFQKKKNRQYTQLAPGKLHAQFLDASIENVQIFREILNVGIRIEASPDKSIVPFAYILSAHNNVRFCGQQSSSNAFVQASGGYWDINFEEHLEYIGCAFNKDYLYTNYYLLKGQDFPDHHLVSQIVPYFEEHQRNYSIGLCNILNWLSSNPFVYLTPDVTRLLCSQVLKLTLDALSPLNDAPKLSLKKYSKRVNGAKRAIDYIQAHARELPDVPTLCKVAGISERSLQYGFLDYIGVSPIQYLRIVRLNGAHSDLVRATDSTESVTSIALSWGFIELGRFAKEYKQLFQQLPSQTLRQS